jgi:hypothetical protein
MKKLILITFIFLYFFLAEKAFAHQPRLVGEKNMIEVTDPEISKAYYGKLVGSQAVYHIKANAPFNLYVNVLVPKAKDAKKDISARILKNGAEIGILDGVNYDWKEFYEPYGGDYYYQGPEFKKYVEAGDYKIEVYNSNNFGKYSLAIGEKESFPFTEIVKTMLVLPVLKYEFFGKSILEIIFSRVGLIYGIVLLFIIFIIFLLTKLFKHHQTGSNIVH